MDTFQGGVIDFRVSCKPSREFILTLEENREDLKWIHKE